MEALIVLVVIGIVVWSMISSAEEKKAAEAAEQARVAELMETEQGRFQLQMEMQERHHAEQMAALRLCGECGSDKDSYDHRRHCRNN